MNKSLTVDARLFVEHLRYITALENPSIPPSITKRQRITLSFPYMCLCDKGHDIV